MKKWLVVIMAFWLASCSSGGENKSYYQLPDSAKRCAKHRKPGQPSLMGRAGFRT